jgi:hypothetical protein
LANGVIVGKKVTKQLNGTCYIIKTLRTYWFYCFFEGNVQNKLKIFCK